MMRKCLVTWLLAALALAVPSLRAQSDEAVFNATVKQVDMGGVYLNYANQTGIGQAINQTVETILKMDSLKASLPPEQLELIKSGAGLALRLFGLESFKAQAFSSVSETAQFGSPMYLYKSFLYTGANPQGISFDLTSRTNKPFAMLGSIPANARLALGGHMTPDAAWEKIMAEFGRETNPQIKDLPASLAAMFEARFQTKLPELLKSLNGEYFLLVTSSGTAREPAFRLMLVLNDQNGALAGFIRTHLSPMLTKAGDDAYIFPNEQFPPWVAPLILLKDNKVTLVSHPGILAEVEAAKTGGVIQTAGDFVKGIPRDGLGYFYVDINKDMVDSILALTGSELISISGNEEFSNFTSIFPMPRAFGVTFAGEQGFHSYFRSNISLLQIQTAPMMVWAGMMLPALNNAREKARNVSCVSNLKQIALVAIMYAQDHDQKLPPGSTNEIFSLFAEKNYMPVSNALYCPSSGTEGVGYYFIGGLDLNKLKNPSATPIAFDKPGNHTGAVNVAFADGHVETVPVAKYEKAEDVINAISESRNLSAEEKADLLERCKKL